MNKRVQVLARRVFGPDVERAATGVARPVPFASLAFALVLLALMLAGATTRSWWFLVAIGGVLVVAGGVVASGRNRRVLVGVVEGRVEVRRLRLGFFASSSPLATAAVGELRSTVHSNRALLLYLAPGGVTEINGLEVALNQPLG